MQGMFDVSISKVADDVGILMWWNGKRGVSYLHSVPKTPYVMQYIRILDLVEAECMIEACGQSISKWPIHKSIYRTTY